jgi:hypothetical protein
MKTSELKTGRTFAVAFEHGDDFMASLTRFCHDNGVWQGYIPMFLAGSPRPTSSAHATGSTTRRPPCGPRCT